jgi:hypothetical protein
MNGVKMSVKTRNVEDVDTNLTCWTVSSRSDLGQRATTTTALRKQRPTLDLECLKNSDGNCTSRVSASAGAENCHGTGYHIRSPDLASPHMMDQPTVSTITRTIIVGRARAPRIRVMRPCRQLLYCQCSAQAHVMGISQWTCTAL